MRVELAKHGIDGRNGKEAWRNVFSKVEQIIKVENSTQREIDKSCVGVLYDMWVCSIFARLVRDCGRYELHCSGVIYYLTIAQQQ